MEIRLEDIESYEEIELPIVYDLCINDNHNYCLGNEILVHNSSKTFSICQMLIVYALTNPKTTISIVRKSFPALRGSVMRDLFEIMDNLGIYNEDQHHKGENPIPQKPNMPRWASRILLEITDVRVERLNSISQEDAQAEGLELTGWRPTYSDPDSGGEVMTPYDNFAELWSSIYGEKSWKANPWVWAISFKRVEGGAA